MRPPRRKTLQRAAAFTLVEVLAALLVLAVALTALQLRMSQHLDSAAYLRDRTVASWVALNQLEMLSIARRRGSAGPFGALQGSTTMGGRTWFWVLTPQFTQGATEPESIVPVTVAVSADSIDLARSAPLVALTGVADVRQ